MKRYKVLIPALLLGALVAGLPAATMAQQFVAKPVVLYGTVTGVAKKQFELQSAAVVAVVHTSAKTVYRPNSSAAAVAGFQAKDAVYVKGMRKKQQLTATTVLFDTAPFAIPGLLAATSAGLLQSTTGNQLTITLASGSLITVYTGPNTKYMLNGKSANAPITYTAGERITVNTRKYTDGNRWALLVSLVVKPHR
ncbi:MAG TPA: DUF5666 domain-containing protein [Chloroflexota bacterium]|jgi:hypothetical protein|nr:DUF5666 domain-containing protein [Chloroflexota bacterium]